MKRFFLTLLVTFFVLMGNVIAKDVKYYKSITLDPDRTLVLYGEIEERMINDIINKMIKLDETNSKLPIYVVINSPGGYIEAGWQFVQTLKVIKSPTVAIIDSGAYSMAAIIAIHFQTLYMMDMSVLMFHEAGYCACGLESINKTRVLANWDYLDKMHHRIADQLKMPFKYYRDRIVAEWWMSPEEAYKLGISKGVVLGLKYKFELPKRQFIIFEAKHGKSGLYYGINTPEGCSLITN